MYSAQCNCLMSMLNAWARKRCLRHSLSSSIDKSQSYEPLEWIVHWQHAFSDMIQNHRSDSFNCANSRQSVLRHKHTHTFLSSDPIWFMSMVTLSVFHTHEWLVKYSSTIMALCNRVIVFIILRRHGNNAGSKREKRREIWADEIWWGLFLSFNSQKVKRFNKSRWWVRLRQ